MSELLKKLTSVSLDSLWYDFTQKECVQSELKKVEKTLKDQKKWDDRTPASPDKILRFLDTDLSNIKVVILGQDPYPQKGVATGSAFEVDGLNSWCEKDKEKMNYSLKNILKAIYVADDSDNGNISIETVREKIDNESDEFKILPPDKWFENMKDQGVLFLNTAFTCKEKPPKDKKQKEDKEEKPKEKYSNTHSDIWKPFTAKLIHYIIENNSECTWLLWGKNAQKIMKEYNMIRKHECCHPRLSAFINSKNGFKETSKKADKEYGIDWLGNKT